MMGRARIGVLALLAAAGLAAGGCRVAEQGRPLEFSPGTYRGPADEKIDDKQARELQQRGNLQR